MSDCPFCETRRVPVGEDSYRVVHDPLCPLSRPRLTGALLVTVIGLGALLGQILDRAAGLL